ncbi:Disease resistance protein [Melia azedarach]|uniref:Disease resistance protein n=1 Tax=Melia azedarach TaxID=155640 RepID=A0ACC1YLN0_MELAZ|nr:Disease resistance protein [Melia azedarach]
MTSTLEQLCKQRIELGLQLNTPAVGISGTSSSTAAHPRPPSSSVPTERVVFGRDEDKANVLEMVFMSNAPNNDANFHVIPILGMPGIGKTTLARDIYNHKTAEGSKFDIKAWVCVSDVFDILSISRALLVSIAPSNRDANTLDEVQVKLRNAVEGKKLLLVLDDVWNEDSNLWDVLKAPFLTAAPNTKIIATTRHTKVARIMAPQFHHYNLGLLSDAHCWSLFLEHAFQGRDFNEDRISEFHDRVVAKCGGLPLAAKTLGGLLRSNREDAWDDILSSSVLNFPQQNGVLPVLQLSYHYLPSHLKRCFAYFALFPKDYEFNKTELVLLWMAEGIIQPRDGKGQEEWGSECFDDLMSRSIVQQSNNDRSKFSMHDLIHDLAQFVSRETIFRMEEANNQSRRFERLPSKMRNLINLRHLDIEGADSLTEMPLGMKRLTNLQTLSNFILGKGGSVSSLKDLKNLTFLRGKLSISGLENLNESEDASEVELWKKQNLQALSLKWGSQFEDTRDEAAEGRALNMLRPHENIERLTISYYGGIEFPLWIGDGSLSNMKVLTLESCKNCGSLPSLGLLGSLKHLTIKGLTKLESINSAFFGEACSRPFQSLETLHFENLLELKYWNTDVAENGQIEIFSNLRVLSIVGCPRLCGKFPEPLPLLEKLRVSKCPELVVPASSFPKLCNLKVDECKGMVCNSSSPIDFKSIKNVTISNRALEINGCEGMLYNNSLTELSVTISNILEFGKFLKQGFQIPDFSLAIGDSQDIEFWNKHGCGFLDIPQQRLKISLNHEDVSIGQNCVSLVLFPEVKFLCNNLRSLKIENNGAVKCLPEEMTRNNAQLEELYVGGCSSLAFVARTQLPSSLKRLVISKCQNFQRLVDNEDDASSASSSSSSLTLKTLTIRDCPKLTTLSSEIQLLEALENLVVTDCQNLESLPDGLHSLHSLKMITIWNCPCIVSFPQRGLPSTISHVTICSCEKLKALPVDMHKFNSLCDLKIRSKNALCLMLNKESDKKMKTKHTENLKKQVHSFRIGVLHFQQIEIFACDTILNLSAVSTAGDSSVI